AGQEGFAAPDIHDRAEDRREPSECTEDTGFGNLIADEVAEHRAERDDGHGDEEHDPEQAPELRDVVTVARMPCMTAVARMSGMSAVTVVAVKRMIGMVHVIDVCRV